MVYETILRTFHRMPSALLSFSHPACPKAFGSSKKVLLSPSFPCIFLIWFGQGLEGTETGDHFKEVAHDLAPVVTDVFNSSLRQHKVPSSWKMADIRPLPKESPLTCCTQLRSISLTAVIMGLFERLV